MNPAHWMLYYSIISNATKDDKPSTVVATQPMPEPVIVITLIIAAVGMIAVFIWEYKENKRFERLVKEVEEHNKNSKDGIRYTLE